MRERRHVFFGLVLLLALSLVGLSIALDDQSGDPHSSVQAETDVPVGLSGALLVQYTRYSLPSGQGVPGGWLSTVAPLAPGTLEAAPGREALDLGYNAGLSTSPDGRFAAIVRDSDAGTNGSNIEVFDLAAWQTVVTLETPPGLVPFGWSDNDTHLYASREFCAEPGEQGVCNGGWQRDFWDLDLRAGTVARVAEVDFEAMRWMLDGHGRAVSLALDTDICCGIGAVGPPFVAVVDLASGVTVARDRVARPDAGPAAELERRHEHLRLVLAGCGAFGGRHAALRAAF